MNSIPRYLYDFAPVPKWEGEDSDDGTERDADSEGTYSDYDEKETTCNVCGNCATRREHVQNIMVAAMVSQMKTIHGGKRLAGVNEELQDLEKTRERIHKQYAYMMYLWRQLTPRKQQLRYVNCGLLHGEATPLQLPLLNGRHRSA